MRRTITWVLYIIMGVQIVFGCAYFAGNFSAEQQFADAQTLLNYGYANCKLYEDLEMPALPEIAVQNGVEDTVPVKYQGGFSYLGVNGEDFQAIEKKLMLPEFLEAPVMPGDTVGVLRYELGGKALGEVQILADGQVEKAGYRDYFRKTVEAWLMKGHIASEQ